MTQEILYVLKLGHMLLKMNYTHIVLIPKKNEPKLMSDYRPLSLGNVVSRILLKVIANQLKYVLSMLYLMSKVLLSLIDLSLIIPQYNLSCYIG